VAANVNIPSDFPRHHRSTSPDRAEVPMVVLVTIASVVVCGWIAVWLLPPQSKRPLMPPMDPSTVGAVGVWPMLSYLRVV
jgi:hypothetical protein